MEKYLHGYINRFYANSAAKRLDKPLRINIFIFN